MALVRLDDDEKGVSTTDTIGGSELTRCGLPHPFMPCPAMLALASMR